jgi:hypothetical protein
MKPMSSNELEFVAEEWVRLAVKKAVPLGLPTSMLGRELVIQGMCLLTGRSPEAIRQTIDEEIARAGMLISN